MRLRSAVLVLICLLLPAAPAAADATLVLVPPLPGPVTKGFSAGPQPWSPGHRGVDLAAALGAPVRSAAVGTVHFAGTVAGRPSVSVDHGNGLRTTYTPVRAAVSEGEVVAAGDVIGELVAGHCPRACLHWGLTDGVDYFDPLAYLEVRPVRLLPLGTTAAPQTRFGPATARLAAGELPVRGSITSHYGMRTHPVTGEHKLHDGLDVAARCGAAVRTPWPGSVALVERHAAYGNRVVLEHRRGRSAYAHLQHVSVRRGQELAAGQELGTVGSTGLSTGCHLHWMTWSGQRLVDPLTLLREP